MLCLLATLVALGEADLRTIPRPNITDWGMSDDDATSTIMQRIRDTDTALFAKHCVDTRIGRQCRLFYWDNLESSNTTIGNFVGSQGEVSFYYVNESVSPEHRIAFSRFVNERCLQGHVTCLYHYVHGLLATTLKWTYGPADAIKVAITNGNVQVIGATSRFEVMQMRRDPDSLLEFALFTVYDLVSPGKLNIVVFPEFFFNRIYQAKGEPLLDTPTVKYIIDKCNEMFGRYANVILAMCFFHKFDSRHRPPWLTAWRRPLRWWRDTECNNPHVMRLLAREHNTRIHMANYQLFVWNKKYLAVYRKSTYHSETILGAPSNAHWVEDNSSLVTYEFGHWKTDRLCRDKTLHEGAIAKLLFGREGMIVPRICADLSHLFLALGHRPRPPSFRMFQRQRSHAKFLLISGAGLPSNAYRAVRNWTGKFLRVVAVDNNQRQIYATFGDSDPHHLMQVDVRTETRSVPPLLPNGDPCFWFSWTLENFTHAVNSNSTRNRRQEESVVPYIKEVSEGFPCYDQRELHFETLDNKFDSFKYYAKQRRDNKLEAQVRRLRKLLSRYLRMTTAREMMIDEE